MQTNRRKVLALAALSATGWALQPAQAAPALAAKKAEVLTIPDRLHNHLKALFGDTAIPLENVTLTLPALAENGNSVALGVTVQEKDGLARLTNLFVFAEKNPLADIIRFEFPAQPASSAASAPTFAARIATRVRLSDSQRIIAIAKYSDGTLAAGEASIVVTLAACIDLSE